MMCPVISPRRVLGPVAAIAVCLPVSAQIAPPNGMRPGDLRAHAIVDATVVVAPGERIEQATIVIRDGVIEAVEPGLAPPADARVWSGEGLTVYPGLIDASVLIETGERSSAGAHWNSRVHPELEMAAESAPPASLRKELRELGITAAAFYPDKGLLRGTGVVLATAEADEHVLAYAGRAAMAAGFDHGGSFRSRQAPGSLMGAIAILRQTLYDAQWHAAARRVWQDTPAGTEPPIRADALVALGPVIEGRQPVLFEVSDEHNAMRALRIAQEFGLNMMLLGSGYEFRRVEDIAAAGAPVIVPLSFPDRPDVSTLSAAERVTLRTLMTWEQAPSNLRRLIDAGAIVAVTTQRLEKRRDFPKALREAIRYGLTEDEALAALTTTPARLLGLDSTMGTVEPGMAANLVVVDGSLFGKKGKIRATWVNGRRYEISDPPDPQMAFSGTLRTEDGFSVAIDVDPEKPSVRLRPEEGKPIKAKKVVLQGDRLSMVVPGGAFGIEGYVQFSGVMTEGTLAGSGLRPDGHRFSFTILPEGDAPDDDEDSDEAAEDDEDIPLLPPEDLVYPLGAYGRLEPPQSQDVLIVNATIWTCGPDGVLDDGSMYVRDGRIEWIGRGTVPCLKASR